MNKNKLNTYSMTNCAKSGVKIKSSNNDYKHDPFANVNPFTETTKPRETTKETIREARETTKHPLETREIKETRHPLENTSAIDLNIQNYSREELYKLFGFNTSVILTEENMKEAKKTTLKTHPDKSRLDNKFFIFFSEAYNKLNAIYEFQNKNMNKKIDKETYYEDQNKNLLDNMFVNNKTLKNKDNFNDWFNDQFNKHRLEDPCEKGYDSWLRSDEDIVFTPSNINKDNIGREMEKRKKEMNIMTTYKGLGDLYSSSSAGGCSLMEYGSNFTSNTLFKNDGIGYTDLKQAYCESVIPVSEDDFYNRKQYKDVNEYKRDRDNVNITPISKEESMRQLFNQDKRTNEESAALAFYYAQQSEKVQKNNNQFWSSIKLINNN